jgi:hypothetical protein
MDPVTTLTLISTGLKMVDQYRELALRLRGATPAPPSSRAEQAGSALQISHGWHVVTRVEAAQLRMDQWDATRYDALRRRIRTNWEIFNVLFVSEAVSDGAEERVRLRAEMRELQDTLCQDFKQMVKIYERTLGVALPDHYQLYEVCQ